MTGFRAPCVTQEQEEDTEDERELGGGTDGDWLAPGASKVAPQYARPSKALLRDVSPEFDVRPPRRLQDSKATLISPTYARKRGWGEAEGIRELTQNWRDGALEVAKRIWATQGVAHKRAFGDLRFIRHAVNGNDLEVGVYINGDAGDAWVAPVYLIASYHWCVGLQLLSETAAEACASE